MINMKDLIKKQGDMIRKESGMKLLTQRNNHNVARAMIAKDLLKDTQLYTAYMRIDDLADFFGSLPSELSKLRNKMDEKYLKKGLVKMYENWQELWSEL